MFPHLIHVASQAMKLSVGGFFDMGRRCCNRLVFLSCASVLCIRSGYCGVNASYSELKQRRNRITQSNKNNRGYNFSISQEIQEKNGTEKNVAFSHLLTLGPVARLFKEVALC